MAQDNMPMVEKTVCAEECRAGHFAAADDNVVAGKKQFTLEDLNFGGKRYREMSPKTLRLWWKGNTLVNADTLQSQRDTLRFTAVTITSSYRLPWVASHNR